MLAWFQTLPNETTSDFNELVGELKKRFRSQNLEFFFRQELYSRKQGQNEPLALYTEDIIKKSHRLSLSDKDMMNILVNGLNDAIKTHVFLNNLKTFAHAENLARLRDSVSKTSAHTFPLAPPSVPAQEQSICSDSKHRQQNLQIRPSSITHSQPTFSIFAKLSHISASPLHYPCHHITQVIPLLSFTSSSHCASAHHLLFVSI